MARDGGRTASPGTGGRLRTKLGAVAAVGCGQLLAQVITTVLLVVISRTTADMGLATAYYGIAVAAVQLADGGASTRVLRDGGRGPLDPSAIRSVAQVKPMLVLLIALVSLGWGTALALAIAYAAPRTVALLAQAAWQVAGRPARAAVAIAAERVIALPVALVVRHAGFSAPVALGVGLTVGAAVVALATLPVLVPVWRGGRRSLRIAASYGIRFVGANIAANLVFLDALVVTLLAGPAQSGLFAVGARMLGPVLILVVAATGALLPGIARGDRAVNLALRVFVVATLAGVVALWAAAGTVVPLVMGAQFAAAVPAVRVYLIAAVFVIVAQWYVVRLQASGQETVVSLVLPVGVVGGLGAVALGCLAFPAAPAVGAAGGYAIACALVAALLVACPHRGRRQSQSDRDVPAGDVA